MEQGNPRASFFPSIPITNGSGKDNNNPFYVVGLESYALVKQEFGIPIQEQMELDTLTYAKLQRDALCRTLKKTEQGREYLDKAYRYTITQPDIQGLKEQFD